MKWRMLEWMEGLLILAMVFTTIIVLPLLLYRLLCELLGAG